MVQYDCWTTLSDSGDMPIKTCGPYLSRSISKECIRPPGHVGPHRPTGYWSGKRMPKEAREKISRARKGAKASDATRAIMRAAQSRPEVAAKKSAAMKGYRFGAERNAKISAAHLGKPLSQAHREAAARGLLGHAVSAETRAKIAEKARGRPITAEQMERRRIAMARPEVRRKISETLTGRVMPPDQYQRLMESHTPAWRQKISVANKGRKRTPEQRARLSEAQARSVRKYRPNTSGLESRAAPLLLKYGLLPKCRIEWHTFDYGNHEAHTVAEINGCYWHGHTYLDSNCDKVALGKFDPARDESIRRLASDHDYRLLELWECQQAKWPSQLDTFIGVPK